MVRRAVLLLVGLIAATAGSALAADEKQLQALLEQEIVGSEQGVLDVRQFCESRVPRMPKVRTAAEWEARSKIFFQQSYLANLLILPPKAPISCGGFSLSPVSLVLRYVQHHPAVRPTGVLHRALGNVVIHL